jgi:hypothetical protein
MKVLAKVTLVAAVAVLLVSGVAFAGESGIAQGKVTAVSDKELTVAGDDGAVVTFQVTQGARVYGAGASHKTRMLASSGKLSTMDAFVRQGQFVTVHFEEKDGTRYLTQLRVL